MLFNKVSFALTALLSSTVVMMSGCATSLSSTASNTQQQAQNALLVYGGHILTMQGMQPSYVDAMIIQDGKIRYTGPLSEAEKLAPQAKRLNLNNKTVIPGIIDAHSHLNSVGMQQTVANLYPPPDGKVVSIATLIQEMKAWAKQKPTFVQATSGWIIGNGYDDAQLQEKAHPTATDLDQISTTQPVLILHQSGHLASVNHKVLELLGINEKSSNPSGGVIRRVVGTNIPNGVLEESVVIEAMLQAFKTVPPEMMQQMALTAVQTYMKNGYTTVQEGRADRGTSELWRSLANQNKLAIDVVSYPDISSEQAYMLEKGVSKNYVNHFRIGGVKISLDGSPQGKTAWLTEPYVVPPEGKDKNYRGYPAFPEQKTVQHMIDLAFRQHWPILAHANGDAAIDQYLNVIANAQKKYDASQRRDVIIHAQTMREDQLDRAKQLHLIPSFFSLHTYYWGDWHVAQTLGEKRAEHISPTGSALRKGMIFTEHHDAPVIPPKSMMVLDATVNRTTRTGKVLGEAQKVSPYIALKTMTDWAAYQYFEEDIKGTLSTGKYGDFVILSDNPITIDPSKIKDIKVLATYKQGQLVYQR
ncbi:MULTISPECIES: amidohydrolase [Acinetobacter]|jgi:predicted amidohydrolase YtcJ|uniref:Amidohydrolase n=1 Tax=Acinetobacter johnsonii TaxID=40214 RepID=A0AAJ6ID33_ACIJO|nr:MULTISPECIES: amidohydrolase [Acinetobacter]ALV73201.1 hydrolase [Acinetobacter johnsonii XBB1]MCV2452517.1 amidohydrolase [Acinetobacter johnsonii]MDG9788403.1 amidohydrolase [Acinetobacter johnsonii]MDG9800553.1 amidohydrolase [Acinetobacter johnsonii]MDH1532581.1 amidohydrolase [Acinetobacter johnsonii]